MKNKNVKVSDVTEENLFELANIQINRCKYFLLLYPYSTVTYLSIRTKVSIKFIIDNRIEIGI